MREKDECRKFLESYRELKLEAARLRRRHRELLDEATQVTVRFSKAPGGKGVNGARDATLVALADADVAALARLALAEQRAEEIERLIDMVPDSLCRVILRMRYLERRSWADIKKRVHYTDSQTFYYHGIALQQAREIWNTGAYQSPTWKGEEKC